MRPAANPASSARHSRLFAIGLMASFFSLPLRAGLVIQSNWLGYQNNVSATDITTASTANAGNAAIYGNNLPNLFKNGDFEFGFVSKGVFGYNLSYFTNNNTASTFYQALPDWTGTGTTPAGGGPGSAANWYSSTYALWGQTNNAHVASGDDTNSAVPHNSNAVYMGNYFASTTGAPVYGVNGVVTGVTAVASTQFPGPAVISQTVAGLKVGHQYSFSFWASGEDAGTVNETDWKGDGVFQLSVTGEASQFLAAPSAIGGGYNSATTSNLGQFHYYQYFYTPTATSATFTWTNWGHINLAGGQASELVLDDVTLLEVAPEASNFLLATAGVIFLGLRRHRGGQSFLPSQAA